MSTATAVSAAELARVNAEHGHDAAALVAWALGLGQTPIVTTNFRPFEAVILHLVTRVQPGVPVVWMDNGYNTEATYRALRQPGEFFIATLRRTGHDPFKAAANGARHPKTADETVDA